MLSTQRTKPARHSSARMRCRASGRGGAFVRAISASTPSPPTPLVSATSPSSSLGVVTPCSSAAMYLAERCRRRG